MKRQYIMDCPLFGFGDSTTCVYEWRGFWPWKKWVLIDVIVSPVVQTVTDNRTEKQPAACQIEGIGFDAGWDFYPLERYEQGIAEGLNLRLLYT